jgi:hypothetical protein
MRTLWADRGQVGRTRRSSIACLWALGQQLVDAREQAVKGRLKTAVGCTHARNPIARAWTTCC